MGQKRDQRVGQSVSQSTNTECRLLRDGSRQRTVELSLQPGEPGVPGVPPSETSLLLALRARAKGPPGTGKARPRSEVWSPWVESDSVPAKPPDRLGLVCFRTN